MKKALGSRTKTLLVASLAFLLSIALTSSVFIGISLATLSGAATSQFIKQREIKRSEELALIWPEVIDHLVSGLYSGLSISEALSDLAVRGPDITKRDFDEFTRQIRSGIDFETVLNQLRDKFSHHGSDQIFEALILSRTLGGGELLNTFRTLGSFQREDLLLNKEIAIKHGWIKSSAHISAAAPWVLLLIIGTQAGTARAFATSAGIAILFAGVIMTFLAYFWMSQISKLPQNPRVFRG